VKAADLSRLLAEHVDQLAAELLSGGHREGREWRAGSVSGEPGASLQLHLTGDRRGRWCDYAADQHGDLLDLIGASLDLGTVDAMAWARRWLGIEDGEAVIPMRPAPAPEPEDPDRWRHAWNKAVPIAGTKAEIYLSWRMLSFDDREGDVMRFAARRARKNVAGELEHHPALLIALRDIRDGEQVGMTNVYLRRDGTDRLRDPKGKTVTGRARGAAMMLSAFDDVTMGLTVCEGAETGMAILNNGLAPVWAIGGASFLKTFPVLDGIESLTIAADAGRAGEEAAEAVASRWRATRRDVAIIKPPVGDWADEEEQVAA
jgi:hypothetical protein